LIRQYFISWLIFFRDPRRKPISGSREDPFARSRRKKSLNEQDIVVFAGNSNKKLAQEIAEHLGTSISDADVGHFSDGETFVR
jgi:hypothetical protein